MNFAVPSKSILKPALLFLTFLLAPIVGLAAPTLGAHSLTYYSYLANTNTAIATAPMATQPSNSTILVCLGRGDNRNFTAHPRDNFGNSPYPQLDTLHAYVPHYPNSGTALYACPNALGGAGFMITNTTSSRDEITVDTVEIKNGGAIQDVKWNEVQQGNALTSLSVTTTGPALLVAFWWGDGNEYFAHTAMPDGGFIVIDSLLPAGSLVQSAVAVKSVASAGTYSVTWNSLVQEGAQLWLVAVQSSATNSVPQPQQLDPAKKLSTNITPSPPAPTQENTATIR